MDALPCIYSHHKKAWIDGTSFRKWLLRFNSRMVAQTRHVLLTLDRCTAHNGRGLNLSNIQVQFFPPNATSCLQPLDQGIISLIKRAYRKRLVRSAIRAAENNSATPNWNLIDAIKGIAAAWNSVSPHHIGKLFNRAWRHSNTEDVHELEDATSPDEWTVLQDVAYRGISVEEFIGVDDDVAVCASVESDVPKAVNEAQEWPSEESEEEVNADTIPLTRQEMFTALDCLERFASTSDVTAGFSDASTTIGCEIAKYYRTHERQR
ncbi:tigger transposable element-derived protein 6-like [Schistocerca gregaria]|uniref:tigger transposable element-derived protein 6-like n=1 Tax=Schistocerca gregaria TaxID=7010 RepID=UPI00211E84D9|nr:tigger transposable element-derived protein 6-like [Schistocerca gregaria]